MTNVNLVSVEIANGDQLKVTDISKQFEIDPSTGLRWIIRGLPDGRGGRIRLEAVRRGKLWLTSRAALARFLSSLPHHEPSPTNHVVRGSTKRESDVAKAHETLKEEHGF